MVICIDRYVAIVYPLIYENKPTDRCVAVMLFAAWLTGTVLSMSILMWAVTADQVRCTTVPAVVPPTFTFLVGALDYYSVLVFLAVGYWKILHIAWRRHQCRYRRLCVFSW